MGGDIFLVENGVSEAVYCWGNSINKELFELLFNIVYLDLRGCFKLHILCLDGTRQIAAGIYVFSGGGVNIQDRHFRVYSILFSTEQDFILVFPYYNILGKDPYGGQQH